MCSYQLRFCVPVLVICFAVLAGCKGTEPARANQPPRAFPVQVHTAALERVGESTEYLSVLKSRSSSVIQPQVEGYITRINVRSGERVAAGAVLMVVDPLKQEAALHSKEADRRAKMAALEWNRSELERRRQLYSAGVISKQELDQAQTSYDAAQADVASLEASVREQQAQLRYYTVRAPTAGVVGDIPVRVGDRVKTDTVLTTLDQRGDLEAYIYVPAEKASAIRLGMPVELLNEEGQPAARIQVTFVSPRVDEENQLLLLKAVIPKRDTRFRNEQMLHARIIWSEHETVTIPVTAVSRVSGLIFAFVVETDNGKTVARQRALKVGDLVGNSYVVLEGINPGEKVILSGVQRLADGMPVTPQS